MSRRVAIVTDDPGWHGAALRRAFTARRLDSQFVSLTNCRLDIAHDGMPVRLSGFETEAPAAVFVRGIPGGTLEQVILRLDLLHALRELDVPVYNDARAIERSVDKAMTSFLLRRRGLPTPPTWVTENISEARAIVLRETAAGHQVVSKPLFGSQGIGLIRISAGDDVPPADSVSGVWYLQRYVGATDSSGAWQDWRILVIGGRAIAAMKRFGRTWINNVAQGARCEAAALDEQLVRLATDAVRALDMDYAGIDVIRDREGRLQILEVNSIPAWKGLQGVCETDIAQAMVDDLVARRMLGARSLEAVC